MSGTTYSYTPRYTTAGDHIVKLQAIGDAQGNGHNVNSAEYSYTQKAVVLATPSITYAYSSETVVSGGSITVTVTSAVENCSKYQYEIAGETVASEQLSYTKVIQNTGKYVIRVMALGGSFDGDGIYYVDSQYAGGSAADTITLLGTPSTSSISITSDGVIKWGKVDGNYGYEYQISYDSGSYSDVTSTGYNNMEVGSSYKQYKTITIRIRAKGSSDGKTITSEWVEWTWTNSNYQA